MRFYYENCMGDNGYFSEKDLIKAIYAAWNIEASLYLVKSKEQQQIVFAPWEENEINSYLLKEFGYYMTDGETHREIRQIEGDKVVSYEWSEVRQLT